MCPLVAPFCVHVFFCCLVYFFVFFEIPILAFAVARWTDGGACKVTRYNTYYGMCVLCM